MGKTNMLKAAGNRAKNITDSNLLLIITISVFVIMYIGAIVILGEGFENPQTFFNAFNQNASLIILASGLSLVMITGGIDISVGGVTALVSTCCAMYIEKNTDSNLVVSLLIALAIGLAFGIVQGYIVAYFEIQPFIVTLAGMFFARGMTTIVNKIPFNVTNEDFLKLKDTRIYIPGVGFTNNNDVYVQSYIEIGVLVALAVVVVMFVILKWTKMGRNFYAVGGNAQSALMLGINVKRTKFLSHVICGLLAGLGGFIYFLHIGSADPSHATGYEMNAIASSIIGGTMLTGGVGNIIGTMFGALSLHVIKDIVSSAGFYEAWWTGITVAGMLCLFLIIQSIIMARKTIGLKIAALRSKTGKKA